MTFIFNRKSSFELLILFLLFTLFLFADSSLFLFLQSFFLFLLVLFQFLFFLKFLPLFSVLFPLSLLSLPLKFLISLCLKLLQLFLSYFSIRNLNSGFLQLFKFFIPLFLVAVFSVNLSSCHTPSSSSSSRSTSDSLLRPPSLFWYILALFEIG